MIVDIADLKTLEVLAQKIAKALPHKPLVISLEGELGAGKTTFSQFLLKALGVHSHIPSPSYTIVNEYHVNDQYFVHADFYRLDSEDSLDLLGWDIITDKADLILVEWPRNFVNADIQILLKLEKKRTLEISGLVLH